MVAVMMGCRSETALPVTVTDNERMVLEKRFEVPSGTPVTLRCTSPDDPLEDHVLQGEGELRLHGILAETRYDCVLTGDGTSWTGSFTTDPLPDELPELIVTGDPAAATVDDGYVLFGQWVDRRGLDEDPRLLVVDGAGRIRWYQEFPEASSGGIAATWLGDRMVLGGGGVTPSLRDLSGDVLFEVAAPRYPDPADDIYNHEAAWTSSGVLSLQRVPDTDGIAEWKGFLVEVTDPGTGDVVWAFDSRDARIAGILPSGSLEEDDPYHANAVTWRDDDPDGPSVWVSLKALQALMRIDRTTGAITMVGHDRGLLLTDAAGAALPEEQWFWGQHAPWFEGDEVLIYDNGDSREGPNSSRVARFRRDAPDRWSLRWEWTEPGWYEPFFGGVLPLSGGHLLIATGHCAECAGTGGEGDAAWILELEPDSGTVVWRLAFSSSADSTYRAQAIGGCELFANLRFCP